MDIFQKRDKLKQELYKVENEINKEREDKFVSMVKSLSHLLEWELRKNNNYNDCFHLSVTKNTSHHLTELADKEGVQTGGSYHINLYKNMDGIWNCSVYTLDDIFAATKKYGINLKSINVDLLVKDFNKLNSLLRKFPQFKEVTCEEIEN